MSSAEPLEPVPWSGDDVRGDFHRDLDELEEELVAAATQVLEALPRLTDAFLAGRRGSIGDAVQLADEVEARCLQADEQGFVLLARESPMGGDLRRLVALLRTTVAVNRSASLLRHVSESLHWFDPAVLPPGLRDQLADMAARATGVFEGGLEAWRTRDALAVSEVEQADDRVDRLQEQVMSRARSADLGSELIVIGLIARWFERIADHGVALARDAAFVVTGERVTGEPALGEGPGDPG